MAKETDTTDTGSTDTDTTDTTDTTVHTGDTGITCPAEVQPLIAYILSNVSAGDLIESELKNVEQELEEELKTNPISYYNA